MASSFTLCWKVNIPLKGDRDRDMTKPIKDPIKPLQEPSWWSKYWFYTVLILLAVIGVPSAFFIPALIPGLINDGNSVVSVRQGILAVLAGALTTLTLSETHRKNTYEKNKNERDHTRQVFAERRSRYAKAVEQLADEKAAVRLGGIYTLAGLVDEWLADDALELEEQRKEGQVIINNLCSYVRAPFPLAEKIDEYEARKELKELEEFETLFSKEVGSPRIQVLREFLKDSNDYKNSEDITADYAKLREEQDIRRAIFAEMSKRSSTVTKGTQAKYSITPGPWSNFNFDFSRALIFYPLSHLTIEEANFASARFYGESSFFKTIFARTANFNEATFTQTADFTRTRFIQDAGFWDVVFTQGADFWSVTFTQPASFNGATFTRAAGFGGATFTEDAGFWDVVFVEGADFTWATFIKDAYFSRASFTQNANFSEAIFTKNANFSGTYFTQNANFDAAIFRTNSPKFVETNEDSGLIDRARFAILEDQNAHNFTVGKHSQPVRLGEIELNDVKYSIPVGTILFDPNSWDEEQYRYIYVSEPAKPREDSNTKE